VSQGEERNGSPGDNSVVKFIKEEAGKDRRERLSKAQKDHLAKLTLTKVHRKRYEPKKDHKSWQKMLAKKNGDASGTALDGQGQTLRHIALKRNLSL